MTRGIPKILVPENTKIGYAIAELNDGFYIDRPQYKRGVVQKQAVPTLKTSGKDIAIIALNGDYYCIRSLTPKETNRLMGFQDIDYHALVDIGQSDTNIYHANGDSIIVPVLIGILGMMIKTEEDTILRIKNYIKTIKE